MNIDNEIKHAFSPILREPAWMARLGHGSFLTFEFGAPTLRRKDPTEHFKKRMMIVRGEWHLWIYCCLWEVRDGGALVANSDSSREQMSNAARILDGQILCSVGYLRDTMRCRFEFDLGGILETWLDRTDPSEQWMLYNGQNDVWTLNAENELKRTPYQISQPTASMRLAPD
ncbi:hypothetical protein [Rhizobium rhizogenes]|nr:hypothetical protein [Rhizobium rhizogenes]